MKKILSTYYGNETTELEVKPCPFCGAEPNLVEKIRVCNNESIYRSYEIYCDECECARCCISRKNIDFIKRGVARWNRRYIK